MRLILLLLFPIILFSQSENLVLNPGFELHNPGFDYPSCIYAPNSQTFNKGPQHWGTLGSMTPDYVIWEPDDFGDCHFPKPYAGTHAVGLITYMPALDMGKFGDYHEYLLGKLKFPLVPGQAYRVEFFIQQGDSTAIDHLERMYREGHPVVPTGAGNLGICFLYNEPRRYFSEDLNPQILFKDPIVTEAGEWKKLSAVFVPDRAFLYFVIGNFFKDEHTRVSIKNSEEIIAFNKSHEGFADRKKRIAYYLIDEISVVQSEIPSAKSVITESFVEKETYVFKHVNFETGNWDLLPQALPELSALAEYLLEHPTLKAEIGGHTDNVGSEADNRILSHKRAEAVHKYLIFKGVDPEALSFQGYGESAPIDSNDTPQGRLENRRVECKLIK